MEIATNHHVGLHKFASCDNFNSLISFSSLVNQPSFIYDIPFPAVTICPETKARKGYRIDFTKTTNEIRKSRVSFGGVANLTIKELKCTEALYQVCESEWFHYTPINSSLKESEIIPVLQLISLVWKA